MIALEGELDLASAPLVTSTIEALVPHADAIFLDLDRVWFIDSTGLLAIFACDDKCHRHGVGFAFTQGSPRVRRLLEITGVAERLEPVEPLQGTALRRVGCGSRGTPLDLGVRAAHRLRDARHGPRPRAA